MFVILNIFPQKPSVVVNTNIKYWNELYTERVFMTTQYMYTD